MISSIIFGNNYKHQGLVLAAFASLLALLSSHVTAQTLEEIVVTAQQREQSLQEVPISIDVVTGEQIEMQGFRNLDDLSKFNPSVSLEVGIQEQDVTIRGFGSSGNTRTLMSATPIFLDGVHFGRMSLVKTAFLDVERVEVLKGPQPLFFGLNATAGAFNLTSKKPTPEWEADIAAEYGNDGKNRLFGAIGGPLTDTLGIRLVGLTDRMDGPVKNNVDPTKKVAGYDNLAGRITLEWAPSDNLTILTKLEGARQRNGSELRMGCLTEGPASGYTSRGGPFNDDMSTDDAAIGLFGYGSAVLAPPPSGIPYTGTPIQKARRATGQDCFKDDYAFNVEGPYPTKPANVTGEAVRTLDGGSVAFEKVADSFWGDHGRNHNLAPEGEYPQFWGFYAGGVDGKDHIDSMNAAIDVTYNLDNGFTLNSVTGMIDFNRFDSRDNSPSPFLQNFQARAEDIAQWSEQIRIESPVYNLNMAGGSTFEFMIGGIVQDLKMDIHNAFPKDNVRRGLRTNVAWEDVRWYSGFWNVNFSFMDNQLSLQLGGRYTDESRQSFYMGAGNQFIFEGVPCDSGGTDANPDTCTPDPNFKRVHPELTTYTTVDPVTGKGSQAGRPVRVDSPIILVDGVDTDNLWTVADWNRPRGIPLNYRSPIGQAVGYTAPMYERENGPYGPCEACVEDLVTSANGYDNQVVLSFTPNGFDRNHTFYGKYAEAFKGPTTDLAAGPISGIDDLTFDPEFSETWELGAKGRLMGSRVRYDAAAFHTTFTDLQTGATAPPFNPLQQASTSLNAGEQRVQGLEFSAQAAVTDRLRLSFGGVLMNGEMKEMDGGGCTDDELIAASIDAVTPVADGGSRENRSADVVADADETLSFLGPRRRASLPARSELPEEFFINGGCRLSEETDAEGNVFEVGTISRTGEKAPRTPDWAFVLGLDYEQPFWDRFVYYFNAQGFISDGYITEETTFWRKEKFDRHGDINLTAGVGSESRNWRLLAYARNILEATKSYNPEYDLLRAGIFQSEGISPANFLQYGVRFEYNFR